MILHVIEGNLDAAIWMPKPNQMNRKIKELNKQQLTQQHKTKTLGENQSVSWVNFSFIFVFVSLVRLNILLATISTSSLLVHTMVYVNLWDMTSPHSTCPCWDSCFTWGGRGTSFEALSKRDDILGSGTESSSHNFTWTKAETISSYSNFVLPWFNSAFWRSDWFFMYSSKSSRPKLPISRSWTSSRSESISRVSREFDSMSLDISREDQMTKRAFGLGQNRLQKMHFLAKSSHIQTYLETTHWRLKDTDTWNPRRSSRNARWICTLGLGAMSQTHLQRELESNLWLSLETIAVKNLWKLLNWQIICLSIHKPRSSFITWMNFED